MIQDFVTQFTNDPNAAEIAKHFDTYMTNAPDARLKDFAGGADDNLAVHAAWERFRRQRNKDGTSRETRLVEMGRFLGALEARGRIPVPSQWLAFFYYHQSGLKPGELEPLLQPFSKEFPALLKKSRNGGLHPKVRATQRCKELRIDVASDLSIRVDDREISLAEGPHSMVLSRDLSSRLMVSDPGFQLHFKLSKDVGVLAKYGSVGHPFPVYAISPSSGKLWWQQHIWGTKDVVGGATPGRGSMRCSWLPRRIALAYLVVCNPTSMLTSSIGRVAKLFFASRPIAGEDDDGDIEGCNVEGK